MPELVDGWAALPGSTVCYMMLPVSEQIAGSARAAIASEGRT